MDSHFHRENKLCNIESKSLYTYSNLFIRKVSLKASLKVNSHRLFSRQAIEVAYERKVTHVREAKLEKMTPLEYGRETSLEDGKTAHLRLNREVYGKYDKKILRSMVRRSSLKK